MTRYGLHLSFALFPDPDTWVYLRVLGWYVQAGPWYVTGGPFPERPSHDAEV